MTNLDKEIAAIMEKWDRIIMLHEHGAKREIDLEAYRDLTPIIQRLQAQLAERDRLLSECEEVLSRFDVSVLTPISRSMYSDLMYKLITKPTEE